MLVASIPERPSSNAGHRTNYKYMYIRIFAGFVSSSMQIKRQMIQLGLKRFLPHPFQFIIYYLSNHSTLYIVNYGQSLKTDYG
jgi:hypothetical protein